MHVIPLSELLVAVSVICAVIEGCEQILRHKTVSR
jgi:hypothetical protein